MDSDIQKNVYNDYIKEIEERKTQGLHPKPIDGAELLDAIIAQIKDSNSPYREDSLKFFIYNTLPGTTPAAGVKAKFLKEIILGESIVSEITPAFAFELLSHMKGGPSIEVLLDLALGNDEAIAKQAAEVLKTQVFLYDADMARLKEAFEKLIDLDKLILVAKEVEKIVGRQLPGQMMKAGPRLKLMSMASVRTAVG